MKNNRNSTVSVAYLHITLIRAYGGFELFLLMNEGSVNNVFFTQNMLVNRLS